MLEKGTKNAGGIQRCREFIQGENLKGQSPA